MAPEKPDRRIQVRDGARSVALLQQNCRQVDMRLGVPRIEHDRALEFRPRRRGLPEGAVGLPQCIVRFGRLGKQLDGLAQLRN